MRVDTNNLVTIDNVKIFLSHPSIAIGFLQNGRLGAYHSFLKSILDRLSNTNISTIEASIIASNKAETLVMPPKLSHLNGDRSIQSRVLLYYLVRMYQPETVVDTGVWTGQDSWYILQALDDNGKGNLTSIDLGMKTWATPERGVPPIPLKLPTKEIGDFVPKHLRKRWHLIIGDSHSKLPEVLKELGSIDFYYHDSDYSAEGMRYEIMTTIPYIKSKGLLASNGVYKNDVFKEISKFLNGVKIIDGRFGYGFVVRQ